MQLLGISILLLILVLIAISSVLFNLLRKGIKEMATANVTFDIIQNDLNKLEVDVKAYITANPGGGNPPPTPVMTQEQANALDEQINRIDASLQPTTGGGGTGGGTQFNGVVNTATAVAPNGSVVTLQSGDSFDPIWAGKTVTIDGQDMQIASVDSANQLTLVGDVGDKTGVAYSFTVPTANVSAVKAGVAGAQGHLTDAQLSALGGKKL